MGKFLPKKAKSLWLFVNLFVFCCEDASALHEPVELTDVKVEVVEFLGVKIEVPAFAAFGLVEFTDVKVEVEGFSLEVISFLGLD